MGRQNSFHKLFIFFGTDIERYGHKFLRESHSQGYTLLPLDSSAVGFARGAKLPFDLIDEYVGLDALLRSRREAAEFYRNWFKPAGSEFTSDDICWPEFDLEAMRWFWQDVTITFELAEAFQRRGGSQLQFFHQEVLRPSVFYYRNDIHAVILNQLFPNKALPVSIPEAKVENSIDYFSRMRITFDDTSGRPLYNPDIFKDRIVLAFNPGESYRFGHVIEQLTREFPGEVAVMLIFPSSAHEKKLSEKYSIPVVSPRQLDFMEPEYQSRFFNGYNKLVQNTPGRLGWTINVLKYHFDNYCRYRWPAFVSNFHTWLNLWKRIRPKAVVVSALSDGESRLPAEAANRYDIPTFAIPHGAAFVGEKTPKVVSKYVLYSLGHQKTHFEKNGVAPDRLICCRNLRAINEHPVVVRESFGEKKNWRILALMNPTKIDSVINPTIEPSKQIEALKILDKPPADIAGQISLIVKVHPGFPELELVSSISSSLAKKILPPDTDLQTVVEQVDLVVAVNYFGAALVQVLCSGKPLIFLTTDRLMKAIQSIDLNYNICSLSSTFNTVGTGKELWDAVRRHFTDGQYAQQMRLQSRQFYRENLDGSKYPTIGRAIKEVLSKSQDKIINAETVECSVNGNQAVVKKCKIEQLLPHHDTIPVELLNYKYQPGTDGDGSVPPHELEVICKIVRYKQPQTILEFGTYEGETTLRLGANSQAEIYTFDLPPEGHKDYTKPLVKDPELDVYPVTPGVKFHNAPWAHRIHQIFADTQTYDFSQFYGKFDVVFVDACHHYEFVLHDSINALKMIRPGGIIIWHDYASYAPGVMQALNKISKKFPLLHIEGTSLAVYCSQQDIKAEDVEMTLFGKEEQSLCKQATFQSEESKIKCSVIIPTYNRCGLLKKTIESLVHQDFEANQYEILIVDNGSTDSTRQVAESAISAYQGHNIRYIFEPEPGLHCGRHRGAIESRGQILCYLDDDVVVDKLWLQGVIETFTNTDAVLVGGKILPKYETEPPEWINQFIAVKPEGKSLGQLSLIDFGNELKQIDPCFVWGCNYSIRKDVLFECGGFHPDSMPFDLIRYRGNGEIALSASIKEKGYKAYYNPKACVYHYISKERLTVEYFCKRMFCQGISDSFAQIRKDGNIQNPITLKIRDAYNKGMAYHHEQVLSDPELLKWILKNEYFKSENSSIEAQLKQFENCSAEERQSFYDGNRNYYEFKERFIKLGVPVKDIEIDINDFEMWRKMNPAMENRYKQLGDVFIEKLLEHYLTYTLLEIKVGDVFIDVAASGSPWADILSERGIESYRLDLSYERGINGRDIGADASDTKLPDNFASVLTLHCAYECFMGDADRLFIKEAERILKNNGRFAIVPLYFDPIYLILTSPYCDQGEVIIDPGAKKVWRDDKYKAPFSRHYSPEVFVKRIYSKLNTLKGQLYFVNNIGEIQQAYPNQKVYCYFIFVGRKNSVNDRSDTEKEGSEEFCAFRQNNLGYKNVPVLSRMGADRSDSRHIERVATIVNLADRLCQEEQIEEALGKYDEAIRLHPNLEAIQYKRASCLLRLGQIAEAEAAIKYEVEHGKDPFTAKKMLEKMRKAKFNYRVKSFFAGVDDDLRWVDQFELSLEIAVIYITERCNSRCITCTSWQNRQDCGLDTKIWISLLKDIRQLGISSVAFTGGEPLLRRDLPQLVTTSKDLGFSTILICTNGLDLKQQRLNELVRCGANSFQISLDGLKDNYKFIRGVDGYQKAMRAIEMIADRKIPLAVLSILMRQNIDDLERIAEIAAGHGASWFINLLENKKYLFKGVNIAPMLIADQTEIGRAIEILRSIKSRYADTCAYNEADIDYIRDYLEDPDREANIPCTVGRHSIYFDPAGNLYSGCMSLPPVGNAVEVPVSEVVSSPAMKKHLKAMIQRKCKGCTCGYRQRAALCAGNG